MGGQPENTRGILFCLFCLFILLLNWPILTIFGFSGLYALFVYLISCWFILTVVVFLCDRINRKRDGNGGCS